MPRPAAGIRRIGGWKLLAALFAALLLSLWAALRFWLPEFARPRIELALSEALRQPVHIGRLAFDPLALSLRVDDFAVDGTGAGTPPLLAFDTFFVDLSVASLWHRAPVVSALHLHGPRIHLIRDTDGKWLLPAIGERRPADPATETPAGALPGFSLANVEIRDGRFVFEDRRQGGRQEISELALGIPFVGTLDHQQDSWVEPYFKAKLDGAAFELKGKVKPFADRRAATLALRLNDLDLTRLDEYAMLPAPLKLLSARLDVALDLDFTQAPGQPFTLQTKGELALRRLALAYRGGAPYRVEAERITLKLDEFDASLKQAVRAALSVDQLRLAETGAGGPGRPLVRLPRLGVTGATVDLAKRRLEIGAIVVDGLALALRREADGQLDLLRVLLPPPAAGLPHRDSLRSQKNQEVAATPASAQPDAPPWSGRVGRFALSGARVDFADRALTKAAPLAVDGLNVEATTIALDGRAPVPFKVAARVNGRGTVGASGQAAWAPVAAEVALDLREIDLVPLQGWAGDRFNALLSRGQFGAQGRLTVSPPTTLAASPAVAFAGDLRLTGVNLHDRINSSDTLNFKAVELSGLKLTSTPLAVGLERVLLDEFFARVILGPDGKLNLGQLVKAAPTAETASQPAPLAANAEAPAARAALPFRIGEVLIRKSRLDFSDRFVRPPYQASLTGLDGRIAPLVAGQRGRVELTGAVDRSAPLAISGEVDPFASELFLNVAARVKGVDMPALSTYSEKHLGYPLAKGKLSLDLRYHIENRRLKADNQLFLDQLTFGDPVDSPDALAVPVTLAVALLKNTRGEIDLKLPIAGSLDDPEFKIGRVVLKVLGNLIVKAVSSPFALLAAAFGEGEELSEVAFLPGRAAPESDSEKRLQTLAAALRERPGLKLEITGQADPDADRAALAKARLERRLRARKLEESAGQGVEGTALREVSLSPEERDRYLLALAREAGLPAPAPPTPNSPNTSTAPAGDPAHAAEARLLTQQTVADDDLRQLAERRGRAVRNWLVEQGTVPIERVFLMVPKVENADGAGRSRAVFSLR